MLLGSSRGSVDKACGSWSMGRGFESHQGHWWCQEGHPTTIAPVLQRQISPKTKKPNQGFSQGMETLNGREFFFICVCYSSLLCFPLLVDDVCG